MKSKKILLGIGYTLLILFYLAYLEVYKNQIFGWILGCATFAIFGLLWTKKVRDLSNRGKSVAIVALIIVLALIAAVSKPVEKQVPASTKELSYTDVISVNEGSLVGLLDEESGVEIYTGIPYAKPPVGELRWREPQAPEKWEGVRKCDVFAPMAMQKRQNPIYAFGSRIVGYNEVPISLDDNYIEAMSEDCLYLNVYRPIGTNAGDKLPVLFYVHGGSLNSGQSYFEAYDAKSLTSQGIIVVNIAYRVGVFGYMADDELIAESPNHTTGNYGLLDQIQALKWVNDNIEFFGGDANNITIAGESAGSSSVNAMCVSPLAKGLFRRVVGESSGITPKVPYHTFRDMATALEIGQSIEEEFGCATINELRQIPANELVQTAGRNNEMTVDGYAIVEQPYLTYVAGNNNEEAAMGGFNGNEAEVFMLFDEKAKVSTYEASLANVAGEFASELAAAYPVQSDEEAAQKYMELVGVAWFGYSHYDWSRYMAANNQPCYFYHFDKSNKSLGTWHAGELPYFYGNLKHNGNYDESDYILSKQMQQYLINYVKTGDPNGEGLPRWETFNDRPDEYLLLVENPQMAKNKYLPAFDVFDKEMEARAEAEH